METNKTIRPLIAAAEETAFCDIARYCFNDMIGWSDRIFPLRFGDRAYGMFDGDVLESALITRDYESIVFGKWQKVSGISFVETLPEHRNADNVSALFRHILPNDRAAGMTVSTLYPFKFGYYEKFGYGYIGGHVFAQFAPEQLKADKPAGELVVYEGGKNDLDEIAGVYDEWIGRYAFGIKFRRLPPDRFDDELAWSKDRIVTYREGGECRGFIRLNKVIIEKFVSHLEIKKFAWKDEKAFLALLYFLMKHRDQIREIKWMMPPSTPIHLAMREPRIGLSKLADWMARPLDLDALLALKSKSSAFTKKFRFSVEDEWVPENTGSYEIGNGTVSKRPYSGENPVPLPVLSSLLFGGYSVEDAWLAGKLPLGMLSEARGFFTRDTSIYLSEFF